MEPKLVPQFICDMTLLQFVGRHPDNWKYSFIKALLVIEPKLDPQFTYDITLLQFVGCHSFKQNFLPRRTFNIKPQYIFSDFSGPGKPSHTDDPSNSPQTGLTVHLCHNPSLVHWALF